MENKNENAVFNYTYSAKEQEELKRIRQKYESREVDKMEQIRRLDANVTKKAAFTSITVGTIGTLIMGSGMSFVMTDLGEKVGLSGNVPMIVGVVVGVAGIVLIGCAYPLYNYIVKKERKRIAPEILRLADELLK